MSASAFLPPSVFLWHKKGLVLNGLSIDTRHQISGGGIRFQLGNGLAADDDGSHRRILQAPSQSPLGHVLTGWQFLAPDFFDQLQLPVVEFRAVSRASVIFGESCAGPVVPENHLKSTNKVQEIPYPRAILVWPHFAPTAPGLNPSPAAANALSP